MSKTLLLRNVVAIPLGILFRLGVILGLAAAIVSGLIVRRVHRVFRKPQRQHADG